LSRYLVTLDFPNNRIYLKPGKRIFGPDPLDLSGLSICRDGSNVVVWNVDTASPAFVAGLKKGDQILTVNGKSTSEIDLLQLRKLLAVEGTDVHITVAGRNYPRDVVLTLPTQP
jgi:C-terminal processing protease CtpA/Prc